MTSRLFAEFRNNPSLNFEIRGIIFTFSLVTAQYRDIFISTKLSGSTGYVRYIINGAYDNICTIIIYKIINVCITGE